jgi:hypothetical protein
MLLPQQQRESKKPLYSGKNQSPIAKLHMGLDIVGAAPVPVCSFGKKTGIAKLKADAGPRAVGCGTPRVRE